MKGLTLHRIVSITLSLCLAGVAVSSAQPSVFARGGQAPARAVRPALGHLTIQPKVVRIGQTLTISGVTRGFVQFLPPFVILNSVQQHTVHRAPGMCGGTKSEPVASYSRPGGGAGGPGTKHNPGAGTTWKIRILIPARMQSSTGTGKPTTIATPPGRYEVAATGVGLDFCTLPKASNQGFSVGYFQIAP